MSEPAIALWFSILGGQNSQHDGRLRQDDELVEMSQALNVIPDPVGELITRPGFSKVRSSAISGTPGITGMFHLGDLADEFLLTADDGKTYRDNANPPGAIVGGTNFTTGQDVLTRGTVFNDKLIMVSNQRDLPQTISSAAAKADLGGTPARGLDVKAFNSRVCMFSPNDGSTTYRSIMSFTSANDDETAWTTPYTTNFLNFGRTGSDVDLLGGEYHQSHLMAFTPNDVYPIYPTPNADLPLAFQPSIFNEPGGGPSGIHAVVPANGRLWWISQNLDVKVMHPSREVESIGFPIQPFLRSLKASRLPYIVGGWEPKHRLVVWAVTDASDTKHKDAVALHVDTGQFTFHKLQRNAFANRTVSGELRLVGGGYVGFFYNEFDSATTGAGDDSTTAIDADIMTPRHHLGQPGVYKKIPYLAVEWDPISTEVVTVQYQLNDDQSWASFDESPITMSGTDFNTSYFEIPEPFKRIRLRFRDNNSGERFRVTRYGFPKPTAIFTEF